MAKILFLAHRVPFPPDKGDKIRAFHLLRRLAAHHEVWLGAGVDEARDLAHLATAEALCREVCLAPLSAPRRGWNMIRGLLLGAPLSVARFEHPKLGRWIHKVLREVQPDVVVVYSSAAARYVLGHMGEDTRLLVDFVDADAQKWRAYAQKAVGPARWLYASEARRLIRFERRVLAAASVCLAISETERRYLASQAPEDAGKLHVMANGVDIDFFGAPQDVAPGSERESEPESEIVFCGRMDYEPNIDAAEWFARDILPTILLQRPRTVFRIVGAAPVARVLALGGVANVIVTGTVPDVRPYLAGAAVVVAPLRIARGIQNKVLEGFAAGRPVVATSAALDGIAATPGREVLVADEANAFASRVIDVLLGHAPPDLGARGRQFVVRRHRWDAQLQTLDALIASLLARSGQIAA